MIILGAGLAGCIAAHMFPGSRILEAGAADSVGAHRALLRFRSDDVAKITGIPFRRVRVWKAYNWRGATLNSPPTPGVMNAYARKVAGRLVERSIGNLDPVERWVAPDDFHTQLASRLPIEYGTKIEGLSPIALWEDGMSIGIDRTDEPVLSTIPLPALLGMTGAAAQFPAVRCEFSPVFVKRAQLADADVFQTVYFPGAETALYRASITGSTLILESVNELLTIADFELVRAAFDLRREEMESLSWSSGRQNYGKILPLPAAQRQAVLLHLTQQYNVFSLGRFATWRNLLLDDLPQDAERIRALLRMTHYERQVFGSKLNQGKAS